jgi:putative redox protein
VRREEHPRVFTRIEVLHRLRGRGIDAAAVAHAIELSDTRYCTVHGILAAAGCELTSRYEIEEA